MLSLTQQFRYEFIIESAGIFWLAAELLILFCVHAARETLFHSSTHDRALLSARQRHRALHWTFGFAILVLAVYARHWMWSPLTALVEANPSMSPEAFRDLYFVRTHTHLVIWSAFITGWVVLEILIVYQGYLIYRLLKKSLLAA